jgi:hypothetical protein
MDVGTRALASCARLRRLQALVTGPTCAANGILLVLGVDGAYNPKTARVGVRCDQKKLLHEGGQLPNI